jgi:holliday junction DNA helicase RuvB
VRDFVQVQGKNSITEETVRQALDLFQIDVLGLDDSDRRLLLHIIQKHKSGPVGLSTLAAALNEDSVTIEEVIEPYLLQIGFLHRTPQGRVVTEAAHIHLGQKIPKK